MNFMLLETLIIASIVSFTFSLNIEYCDVFIGGGSTAALSAALNAAKTAPHLTICLTEPTIWLGGQLTSSAVSAVDFGTYNREAKYQPKDFHDMMNSLGQGNPGNCWVSTKCFIPSNLVNNWINTKVKENKNLKVFYNTVIKNVNVGVNNKIVSVNAIQRLEKSNVDEWDYLLSEKINDWYSHEDSDLFSKLEIQFLSTRSNDLVVVDATEFGDILALSKASYSLGVEAPFENSSQTIENCGQAFTIPFYMIVNEQTVSPFNFSTNDTFSIDRPWGQIWSYRRCLAKPGDYHSAKVGEISNQNWGDGNDFKAGYLFLSKEETLNQINDWKGGVDISKIKAAENRAYGWYVYYYNNSSNDIKNLLGFAPKDIVGTGTGLAMLPYLRDTRRSIGINDFILKKSDLVAIDAAKCSNKFSDRIAIGNYLYADIHGVNNCNWPSYIYDHNIAPYYIPFRALTNKDISNLLVAGKTMAQSFLANAATRLHPQEWATGLAAGIAATLMFNLKINTLQIYNSYMSTLQTMITNSAPIDWDFCNKNMGLK